MDINYKYCTPKYSNYYLIKQCCGGVICMFCNKWQNYYDLIDAVEKWQTHMAAYWLFMWHKGVISG